MHQLLAQISTAQADESFRMVIDGSSSHMATKAEINEVDQARQSTGLSQSEFATALSISKCTLQYCEQGRRAPSGAGQAFIHIARKHLEVVR